MDALSRKLVHDSVCQAVSIITPQWIQEVTHGYTQDPATREIIAKLSIDPQAVPGFSFRDGGLRRGAQIWIGDNTELQQHIIQANLSTTLGGHSGFPVTYSRLKQMFYWRGMKAAKPDWSRLPGLLQPLPVPASAWQMISLDFVEGLPRSGNANCILVVVDSFTKYAHFIPLLHPFTALGVAKAFLNNVYKSMACL